MKTSALFFPFDLFGSGGTKAGVELLADAFQEMLADNKRERRPTRARAYANKVRFQEFTFETLTDYQDWRRQARLAVREALSRGDFLLWTTGNHLGVLPVYDELAKNSDETLVLQFDAHLDIYNLGDCTPELSHGNFLLHCQGRLPTIINVGHRELLLKPDYIANYFTSTHSAADPAIGPDEAAGQGAPRAKGRPGADRPGLRCFRSRLFSRLSPSATLRHQSAPFPALPGCRLVGPSPGFRPFRI